MIPKELQKRFKLIKGSAISNKPTPVNINRRGSNYIEMEEEHPSEQFDDFFEYERELSGLESSRILASKVPASYESPEHDNDLNDNSSHNYILMEEEGQSDTYVPIEPAKPIILYEEDADNDNESSKRKYNDVIGFDFIYCAYIKKNGNRCKRQAPKNKEYCSIHYRMVQRDKIG